MPLVWAHAEHIKLLRSLRDGAVFDMPPQTLNRYVRNTPAPAPMVWRMTAKIDRVVAGRILRLEFLEQARIRWSTDQWTTTSDNDTVAAGLGLQFYDLPTADLTDQAVIRFTLFWPEQNRWEGADFQVAVVKAL
jgi:glucoamylase